MSAREFTTAAERVVAHLRWQAPLLAWLVAELDGTGGWTPVAVVDAGYGVAPGTRFAWTDTFCSRMVQGLGPQVAEYVDDDEGYRTTPLAAAHPIGAYIGTPVLSGGRLVATLCGLDPAPQPGLAQHLRLVQLLGELLGTVHAAHEGRVHAQRRAEDAEAAARLDPLTGALTRRGWLDQLRAELARADRLQHGLALLSLDLDGLKAVNDTEGHVAGDARLAAVARTLREVLRPADVLARLGGDEFAVAAVDVEEGQVPDLLQRVCGGLAQAGLPVAVGAAWRGPGDAVEPAWARADQRMYDDKHRHVAVNGSGGGP
jgi:diguanylate cyclase